MQEIEIKLRNVMPALLHQLISLIFKPPMQLNSIT